MENNLEKHIENYDGLVNHISEIYTTRYQKAVMAVNSNMVETYWKIGQHIIEFEQKGSSKAQYGTALLENLSKDLSRVHGKGFSRSNLNYMRLFYKCYPICETVKINDELERSFYEKQTVLESWNVRELKRQKKTSLFLRLASSKDKEGILELGKQGQLVQSPVDIIREPCVLEFLKYLSHIIYLKPN